MQRLIYDKAADGGPVRQLLGHDRLTTTELYLNLSPEDAIREFMQKW
ncbi:MAG: hypothetical protein J7M26_01615 [Armatimonadetes bacterium]|nr:hypothetical protein [Armatimonadota bacterium]